MSSRIQDENDFSSARRSALPLGKKSVLNENAKPGPKQRIQPSFSMGKPSSLSTKSGVSSKTPTSGTKPLRTALASLSKPSLNATPTPKTTTNTDKPSRAALAPKSITKPLPTSTLGKSSLVTGTNTKAQAPSSIIKPKPLARSTTAQTHLNNGNTATPGPARRVLPKSTKKTLSIYTPARPVSRQVQRPEIPPVEFTHPRPAVAEYQVPSPIRDVLEGQFDAVDLADLAGPEMDQDAYGAPSDFELPMDSVLGAVNSTSLLSPPHKGLHRQEVDHVDEAAFGPAATDECEYEVDFGF